jgi:hypothetical protein
MWEVILISLALSYGLARIIVSFKIDEIQENWKKYRCDPPIIMSANLFVPKNDPRSGSEFALENFNFCAGEIAKWALTVALKPVLDIFYQMINAAIQSIGFTMNLRTLASNLYNGLMRIFDVFSRRFNLTIHQLHKTFLLQVDAFRKANAVANASLYAGISVIRSIMNFFQLMVIVTIAILVILVVMVIFLFWLLAPVVPLIILGITVVSATAFGGSVGGMADAFCFGPNTSIMMKDGTTKHIKTIVNGDQLADDSFVTALMHFKTEPNTHMWLIDGIHVSGSHIVYEDGKPVFVKDSKRATKSECVPELVYCLNTTSHKIPVAGLNRLWQFADWEELDNMSMADWDAFVRCQLGAESRKAAESIIESESGVWANTSISVQSADGIQTSTIQKVRVGDYIADENGWTEIIGLVKLVGSESLVHGRVGTLQCSGASWVKNENGSWCRAAEMKQWINSSPVTDLIAVFTASGTFKVDGLVMRDFSDIGLEHIEKSYMFTLPRLSTYRSSE